MPTIRNRNCLGEIDKYSATILNSDNGPDSKTLKGLRSTLNKLFDAECVEVFYTINTDKLFFGACVMPVISNEETLDILLSDKDMKIKKYCLEFDSKLSMLGLNAKELTAIILHEIGHMVVDNVPVKLVRERIDAYVTDKDEIINLKKSAEYASLLSYAIKDTMYKVTSFRYKTDEEVIADSFVAMCHYGMYLESALRKITRNAWGTTRGVAESKLIILDWVFRVYSNIKFTRIPAIKTLQRAKQLTGSTLTKKELDKVINNLNKINTDSIVQESVNMLVEGFRKGNGFSHTIKMNGIRGIEEDLYEYKVRLKAAQTEDEAIYLLHQINARLTILENYIENQELSENNYEKIKGLISQYRQLREELSNSKIFKRKNYGIWFDYNAIDDRDKLY